MNRSFTQKKVSQMNLSVANPAATPVKMEATVNAKCSMQFVHHVERIVKFLSNRKMTVLFIAAIVFPRIDNYMGVKKYAFERIFFLTIK